MSQVNESFQNTATILRPKHERQRTETQQNVTQAKILIGYSMRSGSTLLQHILGQHSNIESFSDLSSVTALAKVAASMRFKANVCVKPMDLLFLGKKIPLLNKFDKLIWITRDPRDSYLSSVESGYAYRLWLKGKNVRGIDTGLLNRWKRIHNNYLANQEKWHLLHYEQLVSDPATVLTSLFEFLEIEYEELLPFEKFDINNGGDYKICETNTVQTKSKHRYKRELSDKQLKIFDKLLADEMTQLGYARSDEEEIL